MHSINESISVGVLNPAIGDIRKDRATMAGRSRAIVS